MTRHLARIRSIIIVALTILTVVVPPVLAQQLGPDGAPNPTASVASEQQLLQQSPRIEGLIASQMRGRVSSCNLPGGNGIISMKSHCAGSARS